MSEADRKIKTDYPGMLPALTALSGYEDLRKLIGQKITKVQISDDHQWVCFVGEDKNFIYYAEGDCCSYSWIEHIGGVQNLVGQTINDIGVHPIEEFSDSLCDCTQIYKYTFMTSKGYFDLEMRNESNGYYGGSLEYKRSSDESLKTLKEDF